MDSIVHYPHLPKPPYFYKPSILRDILDRAACLSSPNLASNGRLQGLKDVRTTWLRALRSKLWGFNQQKWCFNGDLSGISQINGAFLWGSVMEDLGIGISGIFMQCSWSCPPVLKRGNRKSIIYRCFLSIKNSINLTRLITLITEGSLLQIVCPKHVPQWWMPSCRFLMWTITLRTWKRKMWGVP